MEGLSKKVNQFEGVQFFDGRRPAVDVEVIDSCLT